MVAKRKHLKDELPAADPQKDKARYEAWHQRMVAGEEIDRAIRRGERPIKHRLPVGITAIDERLIPDDMKAKIFEASSRNAWPFLFAGDVGRGKSCTAAWFAMQSLAFKWMTFSEFCNRTHEVVVDGNVGYYDDTGRFFDFSRESWWKSFSDSPLVVIDDLGTGVINEERDESLWSLLERRAGKPLIFTTNLMLDELQQKFSPRIISRLAKGTRFDFGGDDIRTRGFAERHYVLQIHSEEITH